MIDLLAGIALGLLLGFLAIVAYVFWVTDPESPK